ncbi:fungal-specific transcription factor domain-containing protein [Flagelloscypha sp. PMI_526]|nr:fungal-specific transcription factor domain-containing protein [Flagelloscypha sp. PMI_526]
MVKNQTVPPPAGSSTKRKKPDEEGIQGGPGKKRVRVRYSCSECHRRKQKCDRQMPCSHCISRKVPHLCKAYTPGKSEQDMEARIARLESIIEVALPQYCINGSPHDMDDDAYSQGDDQEPAGGLQSDGKWYGVSVTPGVAPGELLQQLQRVAESSTSRGKPSIPSSTDTPFRESGDGPDMLQTLIHECGVKPTNINELIEELPPLRVGDALIDYYFRDVNWTRYPISEVDFRKAYASLLVHRAEGSGNTNTNDICFLGLLFVVLAIAARVAPDAILEPAQRRVTSMRYYWASRRSVLIAAAIQPDTLWMILTRLLSARFLTFDRRITECWSQLGAAVRTAQALGLHRDGSRMGMDPCEVEYRRQIWSYLYHADRSYSLVLGRPTSIQDYYTSTQPPSNIDMPQTTAPCGSSRVLQPLPLSTPTPFTFVILRHQLATIIGKITHHFQQMPGVGSYNEVISLEEELVRFVQNLPPYFAMDPDTSLDSQYPFIPVHRFLLVTEVLFVRTSLHRPYLLRRSSPKKMSRSGPGATENRYSRSRTACFESALQDFQVRQAYRSNHSLDSQRALGNAYREFQMAMIAGIYLVLEQKGRYKNDMKQILERFVQDSHEREGQTSEEMDETTRREVKIIEFLLTKADRMAANVRTPSPPEEGSLDSPLTDGKPESHAQLLLNLHQAKSPPIPPNPTSLFPLPSITVPASISGMEPTSPTFTSGGSPSTSDEDSTAQFLLDNWCNSMNGVDYGYGNGNGFPSLQTMGGGWDAAGDMTFGTSSLGPALSTTSAAPTVVGGAADGADYNYWEALLRSILMIGLWEVEEPAAPQPTGGVGSQGRELAF